MCLRKELTYPMVERSRWEFVLVRRFVHGWPRCRCCCRVFHNRLFISVHGTELIYLHNRCSGGSMIHLFIGGPPAGSAVAFGHGGTSQFTVVLYIRARPNNCAMIYFLRSATSFTAYCHYSHSLYTTVSVDLEAMKSHPSEAQDISSTLLV